MNKNLDYCPFVPLRLCGYCPEGGIYRRNLWNDKKLRKIEVKEENGKFIEL